MLQWKCFLLVHHYFTFPSTAVSQHLFPYKPPASPQVVINIKSFQVGLIEISPSEATYRSLLGKLMEKDSVPLVNAYAAIEGLLDEVTVYVKVWLQYQSLWDMEPGNVYGRLDVDLAQWQKLLMDVK